MPFYDYICTDCGHEFDVLQKIADAPLTECPECNNSSLIKKVTAPVFRLKGSGWYETDFKTGDKKNIIHDDKPSSDSKTNDNKSSETNKTSKDSAKPATSGVSKATTAKDTSKN